MGDVSAEPTMEEILSSIKRVIEESEGAPTAPRNRRPPRSVPPADRDDHPDEVLELSQRAPFQDIADEPQADSWTPEPVARAPIPAAPAPQAQPSAASAPPTSAVRPESILSPGAAEASRGSLEALSRMVVKPEVAGADTLEGMVRDMLRPMLRDWLDANLPQIVETMVAKEIARISGRGL